jgi:hypothetical protein
MDASVALNLRGPLSESLETRSTDAVGDYHLNYTDSTFLTKIRTEQISNLTKTRVGTSIPFYSAAEIHSPSIPNYK